MPIAPSRSRLGFALARGPVPRTDHGHRIFALHRSLPGLSGRGRGRTRARPPARRLLAGAYGRGPSVAGAGRRDRTAAGPPAVREVWHRLGPAPTACRAGADPAPDFAGRAGLLRGARPAAANGADPRGPALGRQPLPGAARVADRGAA